MRKSILERVKSAGVLADEVSACVLSRLERAGFESKLLDKKNPYMHGSTKSWNLLAGGLTVASLTVISSDNGDNLNVTANGKIFSHQFKLHNTDSPRRVACLLIGWLKQAQIRQVMNA